MAYNISDILGSINKNGVLQTNKFLVEFNTPASISNLSVAGFSAVSAVRLIQLRAEQARLPGVALTTADVNRYGVGPYQKMPYNAQFTDTSITFLSDKRADVYNYFYTWMTSIFDFSGMRQGLMSTSTPSYITEYKDRYTTDLNVKIYDNYGNEVTKVTMRKAFPISMNDIPLNWNQQNELLKLTVGFSFRDWSIENLQVSAGSQGQQPTSTFNSSSQKPSGVQTSKTQTTQISNQQAQR